MELNDISYGIIISHIDVCGRYDIEHSINAYHIHHQLGMHYVVMAARVVI